MTKGDVVLLPVTAEKLIAEVLHSLTEAGLAPVVGTETVAGIELVKITVTGKRKDEGKIAAEVKRRKG